MPDLAEFEVLVAIAETGSLGAAARKVGVTQQAVSARLTAIEAQIGVPLAIRTSRGSRLTPAGVVVAEWSHQLLDVAQHVDAALTSLRSEAQGRIKISASQTVAEQLLPRWLVSLRGATRGETSVLDLTLTATNSDRAIVHVINGAADVGFIECPGIPRDLRSRVVARDELVVVVAANHKWARRRRVVSAAELARTPLISREPGSGTRESLIVALRHSGCDLAHQAAPVVELSSTAAVRAAVLTSEAPAVMSRLSVGDDLALGRLHAVATPELDLHRQLRAIWVGGRTPPAGAVRHLLSHINALRTQHHASAST